MIQQSLFHFFSQKRQDFLILGVNSHKKDPKSNFIEANIIPTDPVFKKVN